MKLSGLIGVLVGGAFLWMPLESSAATVYVATNGNNAAAGTNWATAKATIQAGISASIDGDVVVVSNGTFSGAGNRDISFLGRQITVMSYGGATNTIIDCGRSNAVSFVSGETSAVLDGFTIQNAYASTGENWGWARIVDVQNSSPTIQRCIFKGNEVYGSHHSPTACAGLILVSGGSTTTVQNCLFYSNSVEADLICCIIYGGDASSEVNIYNCTFANNQFTPVVGSIWPNHFTVYGDRIVNTISYFNASPINMVDIVHNTNNPLSGIVQCCAQYGSYEKGIITNDPIFLDRSTGNYQLATNSRCVNSGVTNVPLLTADLHGAKRVSGGMVDLGAYESSVVITGIVGNVTYAGYQLGTTLVNVASSTFSATASVSSNWPVFMVPVPVMPDNYTASSFLDSNGNGTQEYWEACWNYHNNPIYLDYTTAVVTVTLVDPDHDGDGWPDWLELQNETDPFDPASFSGVVTISGNIIGGEQQPGLIRAVALHASSYENIKITNNIIYSAVATNGGFAICQVPVKSNYWIVGFIDVNNDGVWSPAEPVGSFAGNPIYLTNNFTGADISMGFGDWDGDGIGDDEEAYTIFSNPSNSLSPIQVDDNGPNDPVLGDPETSDPAENGTRYHPYDAIQKAINVATNGSVIVVMDGTYSGVGNKDIDTKGKAITIRSRYGSNSTTIDVASVHRGFVCASNEAASTLIKGFTIHTWASFFGLSGIFCNNASPTIEDCRIWDCGVAGILCTNGANPIIRRTIIESSPGGVRCYGSSPSFERCLIQSNYAGRGAGVLMESNSSPYFVNTLFVGNRSTNDGGGLYVGTGCNPTGINCTVAFNVASNRGSALSTAGTPLFKNVIVWGNSDPASDPIDLQSAATFTYSCVQEFHPGTGNLTNNPGFVAPGDFQLQLTSPCLDVGTAVGAPTDDYAGQVRPMDGDGDGVAVVDIGAYERTNIVYVCTQAYTHYVSAVSTNPKIPYTNWATAAQHIQSAVNVAYPGALILVSNGTYSTGGGVVYGTLTNRVAINKSISVRSVNGPGVTVIRGTGPVGDSAVRCAYVGTNALLSGFTLANGATRGYGGDRNLEQMGGGAWLETSGVLSNCVITGNSANDGGGGVRGGILNNCTIVGNSVGFGYCSGGGAITSTLINCTIIGNSAWGGGGAASSILNGCTISSNWVQHPLGPEGGDSHGGGVSDSIVSDCVLNGNWATGAGAGGGATGGILSNCTIIGNSASFGGGACDGTLFSCGLFDNSAESGGGAVGGTLYNCTIIGNMATESGGGVYALWSPCTLFNSIVFYNDAPSGANHSGATFNYSCTTPSPGGAGNIADEPQFVNVGSGNFRLQAISPCINRGMNQSWMTSAFDLDGNTRLYAGGVVDMGAYEFQGTPTLLHPEVLYDASFGMVSNRFGFNINWNSGRVVVVDANTNLNTTNWLPIATNTFLGDPWCFVDSKWTNFIGRFYRIRSMP